MKTLKKSLLLLFTVFTLATVFCLGASALDKTSSCGENVTYTYNSSTKELVISGSGAMTNYSYMGSPFYCSDIKSVVIKEGVTTIGDYAFYSCTSLQSVTIGNSVTTIGKEAFWSCQSLKSVTIGNSVTTIGSWAFTRCESLHSVTIPDSVTTIGFSAFSCCDSLKNITVDKNNKYYCSDDYGVLFDKNKTKLIQYPIGNKRTAYTIPDSVTTIGSYAFDFCDSLQSITIPNSVTTIGDGAFDFCDSLNDVYYKGTKAQWKKISIALGSYALTSATIHYHNHTYSSTTTTKKATTTANGRIFTKCTVCGNTKTVKTIYAATSFTLSTTKYIYDGKNKTPKLTVKDSNGKTLVKNTDYKTTVASKRAGIGRYTVKVTFMGNYSGTKNLYFYILPGKPATVKSASQTVSSVKLSWSAVPGAAGYTIYRYSSSKKAYVKEGTTEDTTFTVKSLYAGKKYTFRVVAYGKTAAGKVYNSETYALLKTATKTKTPILSDTVAYKGKVKLFWTATTGETGYTVYYSTSKTSGFKKYKNYESNSGYVNNLTSGKTYYFKVRTYIKTDSGYVYSAWSNIKGVKVK